MLSAKYDTRNMSLIRLQHQHPTHLALVVTCVPPSLLEHQPPAWCRAQPAAAACVSGQLPLGEPACLAVTRAGTTPLQTPASAKQQKVRKKVGQTDAKSHRL
jgi:hypothetical protein